MERTVEERLPLAWTRNSLFQAFYYSWWWEAMCLPQWIGCAYAIVVLPDTWARSLCAASGGFLFGVVANRRLIWVPRRRAYLARMHARREEVKRQVIDFAGLTKN